MKSKSKSKRISNSEDDGDYIEEPYVRKLSKKEKDLAYSIDILKQRARYEYVENAFVSLTYGCEKSLKKGSSALEIDFALQLLGLVAITVGAGDNGHKIYEDSQEYLPKLLKSKPSHSIKVLECLGIVTFIGSQDSDETERNMEIIWKFINEDKSESKVTQKHPPNVVAAAISAWSLLLSDINNGWCVSHKKWKGAIPYLVKQLEENYDEDVNAACIEALGIIFENRSHEKFSYEEENYANLKDMKDDIVTRVSRIVTKEVAEKLILEDPNDKKITLTICESKLTLTTFSLIKQINYLREFLGDQFMEHMEDNEHLHDIFKFVPKIISRDDEEDYHGPEFEDVGVQVFPPHVKKKSSKKRISKSPNSFMNKGRTQLRTKQRTVSQEAKLGGFGCDAD